MARAATTADAFNAVAEPRRRQILDVLAGGEAVVTNLSNPDEQALELPAGTVSASVAATGTTDPVIGPADVEVTAGADTIVYAWGSLDDSNLALATQTISDLGGTPNGVPAGNAGLVATNGQDALPLVGGAAAALAAAAVVGAVVLRRRHAAVRR